MRAALAAFAALVACADPPRERRFAAAPVLAALPPPSASHGGTDVDGDLASLAGTRRLFDYFLSAEGEEPMSTIRARIADHARRTLGDDAATLTLFDRYLAYRREGAALLVRHPPDPPGSLRSLQHAMFGTDTAEAFFSAR